MNWDVFFLSFYFTLCVVEFVFCSRLTCLDLNYSGIRVRLVEFNLQRRRRGRRWRWNVRVKKRIKVFNYNIFTFTKFFCAEKSRDLEWDPFGFDGIVPIFCDAHFFPIFELLYGRHLFSYYTIGLSVYNHNQEKIFNWIIHNKILV